MAAQWDVHTLYTGDAKQVHEDGIVGGLEPSLSLELRVSVKYMQKYLGKLSYHRNTAAHCL